MHGHGIGVLLRAVDRLTRELATSTRIVGITDALRESLDRDLATVRGLEERALRRNAEEPYRLKASCIRAKLVATRDRLAAGTPHEPGVDYPAGATYQPREHALQLGHAHLTELNDALAAMPAPRREVRDDFIIEPL